jgi:hypothetical protein
MVQALTPRPPCFLARSLPAAPCKVLHATGNFMHNSSVDVSLVYTSFFFLEGLRREEELAAIARSSM